MSIYCSFGFFSDDPEDHPAPIIYQGSHVLPSDDDPRGGSIDLGLIPSFISRDGYDEAKEDEEPRPWLRVSLRADPSTYGGYEDTVILDASQVRSLIQELGSWFKPPGPDSCRKCDTCDGLGVVDG